MCTTIILLYSISEPILFADDASIVIASRKLKNFCSVANSVLSHMIKWFAANKLVLNPDKTNIMQFITKNTTQSTFCNDYIEKYIEEAVNTKFLSLQTDNHLIRKNLIEKTSPKLSGEHDANRLMVHISNINTLKKIYYAYIHSIIKYGIIFGATLPTVQRFRFLIFLLYKVFNWPCRIRINMAK